MHIEVTKEEHHLILHALLLTSHKYLLMEGNEAVKLGAKALSDDMIALREKLEEAEQAELPQGFGRD